ELLNDELFRGVINHLGDNAHALDEGLADARVVAVLVEQDAVELDARALFLVAVVDGDKVAFADPILARTVFKDCVHRSISIQLTQSKTITVAQKGLRGQGTVWKSSFPLRVHRLARPGLVPYNCQDNQARTPLRIGPLSRKQSLLLRLAVGLLLSGLLAFAFAQVARQVDAGGALTQFDAQLGERLAEHRAAAPVVRTILMGLTFLGAFEVLLVLVPLGGVAFWLCRR